MRYFCKRGERGQDYEYTSLNNPPFLNKCYFCTPSSPSLSPKHFQFFSICPFSPKTLLFGANKRIELTIISFLLFILLMLKNVEIKFRVFHPQERNLNQTVLNKNSSRFPAVKHVRSIATIEITNCKN